MRNFLFRDCVEDEEEWVEPSRLGVGVLDRAEELLLVAAGSGRGDMISLLLLLGLFLSSQPGTWVFSVCERALVAAGLVGVDGLAAEIYDMIMACIIIFL